MLPADELPVMLPFHLSVRSLVAQPNRLQHERSPYLLQHARNPVDWYPWGEEAFAAARSGDKPVFLSIGYSTCYWCHVMEREVFENDSIAELLNKWFVSIKVDREERPDVDRIYMTALQAMTGAGGWPMSMFLTPDLKPFYGATYIPPVAQHGRPGFPDVLERLYEAWMTRRGEIVETGDKLRAHLQDMHSRFRGDALPAADVLDAAFASFRSQFDEAAGGFGQAPKFPRPSVFSFLLRYAERTKNRSAVDITVRTLEAMHAGGMYDHIGGGFHRYATDASWHVPHFEKMLYDQAQIAISCIEAFQVTGSEHLAGIARDTLGYVEERMRSPLGGFFSAEDAESPVGEDDDVKKEGAFYVWTKKEVDEVLTAPQSGVFCAYYDILDNGNVHHDPHGVFMGTNILHITATVTDVAARTGMSADDVRTALREGQEKLRAARARRRSPHLDDKVLTSWNGLTISAFARAYAVLKDERYLQRAQEAASFIMERLIDNEGRVLRRFRDGEARFIGGLEDHACLIQGLLDLYEASGKGAWLDTAVGITRTALRLFHDKANGGFFDTADGDASLIARVKESYDGAEPSGNAVMALCLVRLSEMLHDDSFRRTAEGVMKAFAEVLTQAPYAAPYMLVALDHLLGPSRQIVLAGPPGDDTVKRMADVVHEFFLPRSVLIYLHTQEHNPKALSKVGFLSSLAGTVLPGAYVCSDFTCELPARSETTLAEILRR